MEEAFTNVRENIQEKEYLELLMAEELSSAENNDLFLYASKLKLILERVVPDEPLSSGAKQQGTTKRCLQESYLHNQCDRQSKVPECMNSVNHSGNFEEHCLDILEIKASDSLSVLCREASATSANFPADLRSSKLEVLTESLKPHRQRKKTTSDLGMLFTEYALASSTGNVILNPLGQWFVDTIGKSNKVKNVMSPLDHHLGGPDGNRTTRKIKPSGIKNLPYSEFFSSPSVESISSPPKRISKMTPPRKQRDDSEITDKRLVSCSSTNSTISYQSSSSGAVSTGLLHCVWKDGLPYFVFSVDDRGDIYVASPCRVESSVDKALDYIYLFHSGMDAKIEPSVDDVSSLVGKMKVSSSMTLDSDNGRLMETEFVLFGSTEESSLDVQLSTPMHKRNKRLPRKVVDVIKGHYVSKHKSTPKSSSSGVFPGGSCIDMFGKRDDLGKLYLNEYQLPSNLELAAIVVKDYHHDRSRETAVGGWGLKFLKKPTKVESSLKDQNKLQRSLNVLVPAGLHGGPKTRNGGPSSLTERWRSGGHCDCGGWDIGCPLTVLNGRSSYAESPTDTDTQQCSSFDLSVEGTKKDEPMLKMVNVHEGLYFIHFQSTLSALQSFSVGVAIIHSQSPSLSPCMYRS